VCRATAPRAPPVGGKGDKNHRPVHAKGENATPRYGRRLNGAYVWCVRSPQGKSTKKACSLPSLSAHLDEYII
jgi:hypothetical protein